MIPGGSTGSSRSNADQPAGAACSSAWTRDPLGETVWPRHARSVAGEAPEGSRPGRTHRASRQGHSDHTPQDARGDLGCLDWPGRGGRATLGAARRTRTHRRTDHRSRRGLRPDSGRARSCDGDSGSAGRAHCCRPHGGTSGARLYGGDAVPPTATRSKTGVGGAATASGETDGRQFDPESSAAFRPVLRSDPPPVGLRQRSDD